MRIILALYVTVILFSCGQPSSLTEKEKTIIIDNVHHTLNNYFSDIKRSGLMAEFDYLDHSPGFFWVPPGYNGPLSYDSVASILKRNAPKYKIIDNAFDTLHIIPLHKDLASYTGRLHSIMTDTSGNTMRFSLIETGVMIKRADGWKLLNGHTSLINP